MNANLCSAAIWPEMGESAALTTGSEAESISAHFLDHLVPHPKRGKYGLYHSPTLSFLSLHCWLRAAGTRTRQPGRVSTRACWGAAWQGSPSAPTPHPTPDFPLDGARAAAERSEGPSAQAGDGGGGRRSIPGCAERCWERIPAPAASSRSPAPAPLALRGSRGAQYPGGESRGGAGAG